jgi:hypothetical protein
MRRLFSGLLLATALFSQEVSSQQSKPTSGANSSVESLLDVRRIFVGELAGGSQATALRDLIIASLNSTKLFVLTENEERADAVLKGAADDKTFTDSFDTYEGLSGHDSIGKTGSAITNKVGSIAGGSTLTDNESHHSKERKHEAYATVRLCNKDGDVLWSTTQESLGAKFRGASADVAAKIARQMLLDYERARRTEEPESVPVPARAPK